VVRGGSKGGSVAVGYTTEAPVWRTTYRLVLGKKARLQGFALVHNDSDEAWNGVNVTLASGRPTSFLFPLAGPRYGRREFVTPEDGLENAPQLSTREAREHLRGQGEGGLGLRGTGAGGGGYGSGMGTIGSSHGSISVRGGISSGISSTVLEDGPMPLEPAAVSEAGDLFLYSVKEPVVLGARKSALLPIIDGSTTAERVTLLDAAGEVFSGVRLQNTTPLTLEGGTLSVYLDGTYGGETQIDRVKPGEVRVLKHGVDLDLLVGRTSRREEGDLRRVRLVSSPGGPARLELTRVDRLVHSVNFTSRADKPRTVLVELPEEGYRVVTGGEEDVRSPGQPRYARVTVKPKSEESVDLVEEGAVVERLVPEDLTSARVAALLGRKMPDEGRAILATLKARLEQHEAALARAQALDAKIRDVEVDVTRVRDNLAATGKGGATKAAELLGQRLITLEGQLDELKKERASAGAAEATLKKNLSLASR
jgi:hypothetical protein